MSFNPWQYKPWWCQPWSILLTGIVIISGTWLISKNIWITISISVPIVIWWSYFLILWPKLLKNVLLENVLAGEDGENVIARPRAGQEFKGED